MIREELIEALILLKEQARNSGANTFVWDIKIDSFNFVIDSAIKALQQESKTGHCKDCKWWKDSDGLYRRGSHAESHCPINRKEVFEGNGYCYMFEQQERSDKE